MTKFVVERLYGGVWNDEELVLGEGVEMYGGFWHGEELFSADELDNESKEDAETDVVDK